MEQPVPQLGDGAKVLPMTPIKGYSPITTAQQSTVNANKELEEQLLRILDTLKEKDVDLRWLAIARTHFEQGFMALNRSIFKPKRVSLPGDETPQ